MNISVCLATYNGEKYISQQLTSIIAELSDEDEIIVIDDCSTDGTVKVVEAIDDHRIVVHVNDRNRGEVHAFGRAMLSARNDLVFLSDQDDVWIPGRVAIMRESLVSSGSSLVSSNFHWVSADGDPIEVSYDGVRAVRSRHYFSNIVDIFLGRTNYFGCAMALRREFVEFVTPMPWFVESHDLWIALAGNLIGSNLHLDDHTLWKRRHINNATSTVSTRTLYRKLRSRLVFAVSLIVLYGRLVRRSLAKH